MAKRVVLIVLDSVGIGAMPDADAFGDAGAHTLGHIYEARGNLALPHMTRLGLAKIEDSRLPDDGMPALGCYGRCAELTHAKDTTCGHWEIAGLPLSQPFQTFPDGFPAALIVAFEKRIGRKILGNCVASGTEIIQMLGDEHVKTGRPIVYTSADSVFQIAAHEEVIPLDEQYRICEAARELLTGDYLVGRVIARPFVGKDGQYSRTENRRDYAMPPFSDTILDGLQKCSVQTTGVGKIEDIFCHRGLDQVDHTKNNPDGISATIRFLESETSGFIFTNLVDFDMLYGHRNDVEGYAQALEAFDCRLPEILAALRDEDILLITADHGCDPTDPSTDHSREYIPLLATGKRVRMGVSLGTRSSFADIGSTVYEYLTGKPWTTGVSFLNDIMEAD